MLNWYDTWPIFLYISENPDNIKGLGMDLIHKILENKQKDDSMYATIERLSGVPIKTILGGMSKRLATMDFSRQKFYLEHLNNETLREPGKSEWQYPVTHLLIQSTEDRIYLVLMTKCPVHSSTQWR